MPLFQPVTRTVVSRHVATANDAKGANPHEFFIPKQPGARKACVIPTQLDVLSPGIRMSQHDERTHMILMSQHGAQKTFEISTQHGALGEGDFS